LVEWNADVAREPPFCAGMEDAIVGALMSFRLGIEEEAIVGDAGDGGGAV